MAEFLLDRGADPNTVIQDDGSALSAAASKAGNLQLVEHLLNYDADVKLGNGWVFHQAVWGGEKILERLFKLSMK